MKKASDPEEMIKALEEARRKLRDCEDRFQSFTDSLPQIIFEANTEGKIVFANRNAFGVFGYTEEDFDRGLFLPDMVVPEERTLLVENFRRVLAGEKHGIYHTARRKDGGTFPISVHTNLKKRGRKTVGFIGIVIDITKRKQMEDELRRGEERLRLITDHILDIVGQIDTQGILRYISPSVKRLLGYDAEELIGKPWLDVIHPEDSQKVMDVFLNALGSSRSGILDCRVRHKAGQYLRIEGTGNFIVDEKGNISGSVFTARDVTEQRRTQEALRVSEERLRMITDNVTDVVTQISVEGIYEYVSPSVKRILGYDPKVLLGRSFVELVHPDDLDQVVATATNALNTKTSGSMEFRYRHADGHYIWMEAGGKLIMDEHGEVSGAVFNGRDITESKQAEEDLQESRIRFLSMTENVPGIIYQFVLHPDGSMSVPYVSESASKMDLDVDIQEIIADPLKVFELVPPAEREWAIASIFESAESMQPWIWEGPVLLAGRQSWFRGIAHPRRMENGDTLWDGLLMDATAYKNMEDSLRQSESRYRAIFENTGTANVILEEDMTISLANTGWEKISKYSREETEGKRKWTDFVLSEDMERLRDYHKRRRTSEDSAPHQYEFRFRSKTGEIRNVMTTVALIPGTKQRVASMIDITALKEAGKALKDSEERWHFALEGSGDGVCDWNLETKEIFFSQRWKEIFGYGDEDLSLTLADYIEEWGKRIHPRDLKAAYDEIQKHFRGETPFFASEHRILCKDGNYKWVLVRGRIMSRSPKGEPIRIVSTYTDISDRKRLEAQLLQAQKMEAVGTLAGGIAHDFNNLLLGIQGNASLAILNIDSRHPSHRHLNAIEEIVRSGADLTRQLLGFARHGKYEVKTTEPNVLIERTIDLFARTRKDVRVHKKLAPDLWNIEADQGQMEQVLLNLYVNAWQAMEGGGDLYLETSNIVLDENYVQPLSVPPGNYIKISVTDTGVGMDAKTKERLFEPFFTTKEVGRGLGLASAYGIIKNHEGFINVYSEKGLGTTFNIYLPATEKSTTVATAQIGEIKKGDETILLVDDEDIVEVTREILETLGYKPIVARSGAEAIDIYKERKEEIDLVILDMIMPGMGGRETFDNLKVINPDIKVILSSGYSINGEANKIMQRGCAGFIQKPFTIRELSQHIRDILDREK
ncbi:MAG: PAS domain S-box protein [Smithellaceae bacterium]|nr:PAS domain S-box protein [Smithellaceae bacterium]